MHKLFEIDSATDLGEFAAFLWQHKVGHRIVHRGSMQEVWLANPDDAEFVISRFNHWQRGEPLEKEAPWERVTPGLGFWLRHTPVTLALIGISLGLTLLTSFGNDLQWLHWFTFVDFNFQGSHLLYQSLATLVESGQWWRWLTPIFLHFSFLHLVFNLLWTWELGRRIEWAQPRWVLLGLVLALGVGSNIAQYLMSGPMFGGLSGVIFGLMGYTWLWDRLEPRRAFGLPQALMTFMMIWLVLGVSGLIEKLGFGAIANTAHLSGLLCGLAAVPLVRLFGARAWRH
ncbi:rhomboid family intramembrane serine protease [Motiliproteus sp. SC1-56]|uniref:rhomboid family intramembrane serine protease n=1 Tax=Motiliproteus sp. SC1-56 TaxID=2799565 RepID=UPI001A8EDEEE|nr:rhomboid family intramembrane serine protease [Motiliproteus sp. SC1-56]